MGDVGVSKTMEFPLFPFFPAEIRLAIWEAAIETPRIIHVGSPDKVDTSACVMFKGHLCTQVTNIFHVNQESREQALRYPFVHFSVFPDRDCLDSVHFLITPHDIVAMGAMLPLPWYPGDAIFSCGGDAHLVQHMMINWEARSLESDLEFLSPNEALIPILHMTRQSVQAFGNRESLRTMFCLLLDEGQEDTGFLKMKDPQALAEFRPHPCLHRLYRQFFSTLGCFRIAKPAKFHDIRQFVERMDA